MNVDDALKCYTYRHSDLISGYCEDNILECDWESLRHHKETVGVTEGRKVACKNRDTQCYAYRYPDVFKGLCNNDINSCRWIDILKHYAQTGRFESRELDCETPETTCFIQRNQDVAASLCNSESHTCDWPRVVEYITRKAKAEGRPTDCLPPSGPSPSPSPPPPPSPFPRPPPLPSPPMTIVGIDGQLEATTSIKSEPSVSADPSQLSGSVIIITMGITVIAAIIYCFCRIYALMIKQHEIVTAAEDDIETDVNALQEWDDHGYDDEDRTLANGKKKKKSKKNRKHFADYD